MLMAYKNHIISTQKECRTSPFGLRVNPVTKTETEQHDGIDIVDANGLQKTTDVYSIAFADGVVVDVHNGDFIGHGVDVLHAGNILTRQYHFKAGSVKLKVGDKVKKGDRLGILGTTGRSTGVHLHFALKENSTKWNNGKYVDPEPYLNGIKTIENSATTPNIEEIIAVAVKHAALFQDERGPVVVRADAVNAIRRIGERGRVKRSPVRAVLRRLRGPVPVVPSITVIRADVSIIHSLRDCGERDGAEGGDEAFHVGTPWFDAGGLAGFLFPAQSPPKKYPHSIPFWPGARKPKLACANSEKIGNGARNRVQCAA